MNAVEYVNPEGLPVNPAFTQAVAVSGPHRTIYIGGHDAVDATGQVVGRGDIAAQTQQIFANLRRALRASDADLEHVVKWTIYVVDGQPIEPAFAVFEQEWGQRTNPPVLSMMFVAGLAHPEFLAEIDAVAVVPQ